MENEKLKILKMLEDGRITAEQAANLLESVSGGSKRQYEEPPRHDGYRGADTGPRTNAPARGVGFDDFAGDLGRKFETLAKDWEPALTKFTEAVASKTADMADKLSQTLDTSVKRAPTPGTPYNERRFEARVSSPGSELHLLSHNGNVRVKGYNGDKITLKVTCVAKRAGGGIELVSLGNKYVLQYDDGDFDTVSIDAYVPESMFNVVRVGAVRGNTDVSTLRAEHFQCEGENGDMVLSDITARNGRIDGFNGNIAVRNTDIANMKLATTNGGIAVSMNDFIKYSDYVWLVDTSNGRVTVNLPSSVTTGYHIKAHTSLGEVRIGLVGLNYSINSGSNAEARSHNFDECEKKIKISLETSNAPIVVN